MVTEPALIIAWRTPRFDPAKPGRPLPKWVTGAVDSAALRTVLAAFALATADAEAITPRTGGYWHHMVARRAHLAASDTGFQDELLDRLADLTGLALPK